MPYRLLRPEHQDRLLRASTILPVIVFLMGLSMTLAIAYVFQEAENRERRSNWTLAAKDYSRQIELSLLNNTLRVQSIISNYGQNAVAFRNQRYAIEEMLKHTDFKRVTILRRVDDNKAEILPVLKRVFLIRLQDDPIPTTNAPYIESISVRKKIKMMAASGEQTAMTIHRGKTLDTMLLIIHLASSHNEYAVFATPVARFFADSQPNSTVSALISDNETGSRAGIHWKNDQATVVSDPEAVKSLVENSDPLVQASLDSGQLGVSLKWLAEPKPIFGPLYWTIAGTGFIIMVLISLLLRFILDQNRKIADLVLNRTLALESALNEATEANLAKTRFLANVSHELRTPLNIILGMLDLVEERSHDPKVREFVGTMKVSGDSLLRLISDLLEIAKKDHHDLPIKNVPFRTPNFFEEIGRLIAPECRRKGLGFQIYIAPEVPSAMRGDPSRVRQVLLNLLRNSIKYTTEGNVELVVSTVTHAAASAEGVTSLRMAVTDTGVGIPTTKFKDIFERFVQLDSSKILGQGGVGLGLSIVKDLVSRMGGNITVQSAPGVGSTFAVDLDFEIIDASSWVNSFANPAGTVKTAVVTERGTFANRLMRTLSGTTTELVTISGSDFNSGVGISDFKYFIIDAELKIDRSIARDRLNGKSVVIIGEDSDLKNLSTVKRLEVLDDHPVIPSSLLTALGFRRMSKDGATSSAPSVSQLPSSSPTRSLNLLVADDDESNRHLYEAYFTGQPWKLHFATNGQEAFESYKSVKPDIVIADLRMPVMDGFEMTEQVRSYERSQGLVVTPIILVTADALEETAEAAKRHGVSYFLTKPIRKNKILEAINQAAAEEPISLSAVSERPTP